MAAEKSEIQIVGHTYETREGESVGIMELTYELNLKVNNCI